MMKSRLKFVLAAVMTLSAGALAAAQERDHNAHHASSSAPAQNDAASAMTARSEGPMSEGVVRKVDRSANKVTIKHGELVISACHP